MLPEGRSRSLEHGLLHSLHIDLDQMAGLETVRVQRLQRDLFARFVITQRQAAEIAALRIIDSGNEDAARLCSQSRMRGENVVAPVQSHVAAQSLIEDALWLEGEHATCRPDSAGKIDGVD